MKRIVQAFILAALMAPLAVWAAGGFHWGIIDGARATVDDLRQQLLTQTPEGKAGPETSRTMTVTPALTPVFSASVTGSLTTSFSETPSGTASPSVTPSATTTVTVSETTSCTLTGTPTPSQTPTSSPTPSPTLSGTGTFTGTVSATPSASPTGSNSPTATASPTCTASATPSASPTVSPSSTITPVVSGTPGCSVAGYYDTDSSASFDGDVIYFMPLTITAAQSVVNITVNMAGFNIAALQCALYADDGSGRPGALLATSDAIDVGTLNPALSGPITMDIGGAGGVALSAGTAWLGILGTTGSGYTLVASAEQDSDFQYLDAASFPASVGAAATDEGGGFGALAVDLNACAVAPTPVPTALPQGIACTCGCQCASGHCVNGHCCNNACASTCQACAMALTGQPDGTCANMFAGSPAPSGECPIGAACGNTGNCGPGGVCEVAHSGTVCTGGTCNGTGSCIP